MLLHLFKNDVIYFYFIMVYFRLVLYLLSFEIIREAYYIFQFNQLGFI